MMRKDSSLRLITIAAPNSDNLLRPEQAAIFWTIASLLQPTVAKLWASEGQFLDEPLRCSMFQVV